MVKVKLSQGESDACLGANGKRKLTAVNVPPAPTLTLTHYRKTEHIAAALDILAVQRLCHHG